MLYEKAVYAITRNIVVKGVPMDVVFDYFPAYPATRDEPGFDGEIEIDAILIDEFDVINMFGENAIALVEQELWKILEEGEDV